jgi:hypothetical protein
MPCINFTTGPWGLLGPNERICSDQMGNTFTDAVTDSTTAVSFLVVDGKAFVDTVSGNRMLFFSNVDCGNTVHPNVTLVIRFTRPQERVTFQLNFDEHGTAPAMVNFFTLPNNPSPSNLVGSQSIPWNGNQFVDVIYDNCCYPIQEITIRTDRPENSLNNFCWELSHRRFHFLGRLLCLCPIRRCWLAFVTLLGQELSPRRMGRA